MIVVPGKISRYPFLLRPSFEGRAIAIDCETTGISTFHGARPFAISGCNTVGQRWYWEWSVNPKTRKPLIPKNDQIKIQKLINSYDQIIFHNAKFDIFHLEAIGIGVPWQKVHDTLPMSHVLDSKNSHELKDLALRHFDILDDDEFNLKEAVRKVHRWAKKKGWECRGLKEDSWMLKHYDPKNKLVETYCTRDTERTIRLFMLFRELLVEEELDHLYQRELALIPLITGMEKVGLTISQSRTNSERARFFSIAQNAEYEVCQYARKYNIENFKIRSTHKLQTLLFDKLRLPVIEFTEKGARTTRAGVLSDLKDLYCKSGTINHKVLEALLRNRKATKACDYLEGYKRLAIPNENGFSSLHPTLNPTGTSTTRFSGQDPNPQNVSDKEDMPLRKVFGPGPGYVWLDYDYSNIEMRLFAYLAEEKELIEAFEKGQSVHMTICEALHGPGISKDDPRYKQTKNGNFAIIYGAGEERADATYGIPGAYQRIRNVFPGLKRLTNRVQSEAEREGYVTTLFGYRLQCPELHAALNYLIQGTAGEVMKYGMLNVLQNIPQNLAQMVLTVHDELIVQVLRERLTTSLQDRIVHCMEDPGIKIGIPTPVSRFIISTNWSVKENS
jgi:DNA polymerase I-like protein with 3'-5' exonuclease and polymerase domains